MQALNFCCAKTPLFLVLVYLSINLSMGIFDNTLQYMSNMHTSRVDMRMQLFCNICTYLPPHNVFTGGGPSLVNMGWLN